MGNIPKRNGFSSSNIKEIKKKNSSNKTNEMNDILNSAKKNLSKEMSKNSNNKEKEIKVKNTIMKNKKRHRNLNILASTDALFSNEKNNLKESKSVKHYHRNKFDNKKRNKMCK